MLRQLTTGITDVPKIFTSLCEEPFDAAKALSIASMLGSSTTSYEDQVLGGRVMIYSVTRSCRNARSYLEAYQHRLNTPVANFIDTYADELTAAMKLKEHRDYDQVDFFSAGCITRQYLLKTSYDEEPLECIQMMHMRQAIQFYHHRGLTRVLQAYEEMSDQLFTHASPTIFNAGTNQNQESSCFKIKVADDMDDISGTVHTISCVAKLNGGVGIDASELRHSSIGYVGVSEGPCGFLGMYDKTIGKVSAGGKRNGAGTAFLKGWHYDFSDFVKLTDNYADHTQRLSDLNTCAWMFDLQYTRIHNAVVAGRLLKKGLTPDPSKKTYWTMFCPKKAEALKGLYGIDFIRAYHKMEDLADEREATYIASVKDVKAKFTLLQSNPDDAKIRSSYLEARQTKLAASKARIDHKIIDAYQLYKSMIAIQTNSGMPYMMNGDACQKSNQKNLGSIEQSNLCLEILEYTKAATKHEMAEIASCNLGSMNIPRYVKGEINWEIHDDFKTPEECIPYLLEAYDFNGYGTSVRSLVENLNEVIDHNYYPLETRDDRGNVVKRGPISTTNFKHRPIGVGVSGQSDAVSMMDCTYDGKPHTMFNTMLYACQYWNAMIASMVLAVRDGEYETFRSGSYRRFIGIGEKGADVDGMITEKGSPLSNGQFQFDLWKEEAQMLKAHGLLDEKIYNVEDDEPLDPAVWGTETTYAYVIPSDTKISAFDKKVDDLKHIEITTIRRDCRPHEIEIVIEPTWECLRQLVMKYGVRNSLLIALMPTASSANILRNCESTEAHQSMIYARDMKSGNFTILVRHLYYDLVKLGLWSSGLAQFIAACEGTVKYIKQYIIDHVSEFDQKAFDFAENTYGEVEDITFTEQVEKRLDFIIAKYKTMYELSQKEILILARQRGIYVCQSQSTNIYMRDPTDVKMEALHIFANRLRLKTGMYYLRQSPAKSAGDFTLPAILLEYVKNLLGANKQELSDMKSNGDTITVVVESASSNTDVVTESSQRTNSPLKIESTLPIRSKSTSPTGEAKERSYISSLPVKRSPSPPSASTPPSASDILRQLKEEQNSVQLVKDLQTPSLAEVDFVALTRSASTGLTNSNANLCSIKNKKDCLECQA